MWVSNLRNTEAAMVDFYESCLHSAEGSFRIASDTYGQDIKAPVDVFLRGIQESPLALIRGRSIELIHSARYSSNISDTNLYADITLQRTGCRSCGPAGAKLFPFFTEVGRTVGK